MLGSRPRGRPKKTCSKYVETDLPDVNEEDGHDEELADDHRTSYLIIKNDKIFGKWVKTMMTNEEEVER